MAHALISHQIEKCSPESIKEWEEDIRFDGHSFWLQCLLEKKSFVVSFDYVYQLQLLDYWILKGNLDACIILLEHYPSLIANEYPKKNWTKQNKTKQTFAEYIICITSIQTTQ